MGRRRKGTTTPGSYKKKAVASVEQTKSPVSSRRKTMHKFPKNWKSAAQVLHDEKLTFKMLDAYAFVDLRDVTINPYEYMSNASQSTDDSVETVDSFARNLRLTRKSASHNVHEQIIIMPSEDCNNDDIHTTSLIIDIASKSPKKRGRPPQRSQSAGARKQTTKQVDKKVVKEDVPQKKRTRSSGDAPVPVRRSNRKQKIIEISDDNESDVQNVSVDASENVVPSKKAKRQSTLQIDSEEETSIPEVDQEVSEEGSDEVVPSKKARRQSTLRIESDEEASIPEVDQEVNEEASDEVVPSKKARRQSTLRIESDEEASIPEVDQEVSEQSSEEVVLSKTDRRQSILQMERYEEISLASEEEEREKEQEEEQEDVEASQTDLPSESQTPPSDEEQSEPEPEPEHESDSGLDEEQPNEKEQEQEQEQVTERTDDDLFERDTDVENENEKDAESPLPEEPPTEENVTIQEDVNELDVDKMNDLVVGKQAAAASEKTDISMVTSTQELLDILAGQEIPVASSDISFDDAPSSPQSQLNESTSSVATVKLTHSQIIEGSKRIAAESIKLLGITLADTGEAKDSDVESAASEPLQEIPSLVEDKENLNTVDIANQSLNNSMSKKRSSFKIRFKKAFEYTKHICTDCQKIFRSNVDLQLHSLQHLDNRNLSVRVFRAILPLSFDTAKDNINRYLNPRKKAPVKPIDVDAIKSLVGKYCRDDSFLEPFDSLIEGDISQSIGDEEDSQESNRSAGAEVTVLSDLTIVPGDKPEHMVEINEDQLEAYAIASNTPTPTSEVLEQDDGTQEIDLEVVPETQDITPHDDVSEVVEVATSRQDSTELDAEDVVEEKKTADVVTYEIDDDSHDGPDAEDVVVVPETQTMDTDEVSQVIDLEVEAAESEALLGDETLNCRSESPETVDISDSSVATVTVTNNVEESKVKEAIENNSEDKVDKELPTEDVITSTSISFHVSDDVSSEADATECPEKKRKRNSTDEQLPASVCKRPRLSEEDTEPMTLNTSRTSNTSEDFLSCADALSPKRDSLISEDNSEMLTAHDASPSKCSETSEGENPEHMLKLAKLDNQLQKIIDNHKDPESASEKLDNTLTQEEFGVFDE